MSHGAGGPHRNGSATGWAIVFVAAVVVVGVVGFGVGSWMRGSGAETENVAAEPAATPATPGAERPALPPTDRAALATADGDQTRQTRDRRDAASTPPPADRDRPAGPKPYRFEPVMLNFGILEPRQEGRGSVKIHNISDKPLKILSVKEDCKCTAMNDLVGAVIQPGEYEVLDVTLAPRDIGGNRNTNVNFVFEGYGPGSINIRAQYARMVSAKPGYLLAMEETSGRYTLEAVDRKPFRVLAVNGGPPEYVDFDPASGEVRSRYEMKWDISAFDPVTCEDSEGNRMPMSYVVETDHPEAPVVEMLIRNPCTFQERPGTRMWRPERNHMVLNVLKPGEATEFTMSLIWRKAAEPNEEIQAVLSESEDFTAELVGATGTGAEREYTIRITPDPELRGLLYGSIRLQSEQHSAPLQVIASVRE